MGSLYVPTGILLGLFALAMSAHYLRRERGSLFDPITVSWIGYLFFIVIAMVSTGVLYPVRRGQSAEMTVIFLTLAGTAAFCLGLYLGRGERLARALPVPAPTLSKPQVWIMWIICGTTATLGIQAWGQLAELATPSVMRGVIDGTLNAALLLSLLAFFTFRFSPITKLVMGASLVVGAMLILNFYWSRRPLIAFMIVTLVFVYRFKLSQYSRAVRAVVLVAILGAVFVLQAYLDATRGQRFYGTAAGRQHAMFSAENFMGILGGIDVNFRLYEVAVAEIPSTRGYLRGAGYVPAFTFLIPRVVWPDKPVSSGYTLSQMWFRTRKLESNIGVPPPGELYANFGPLGVILGLFVCGKVVRVINSYLRYHSSNLVLWLAWLLALPDFAGQWRGDFTAMTVQPLLRVAVFLGLAWLIGLAAQERAVELPARAREILGRRRAPPIGARQTTSP